MSSRVPPVAALALLAVLIAAFMLWRASSSSLVSLRGETEVAEADPASRGLPADREGTIEPRPFAVPDDEVASIAELSLEVFWADGSPAGGIRLQVSGEDDRQLLASVLTDATGRARLRGPVGNYRASVGSMLRDVPLTISTGPSPTRRIVLPEGIRLSVRVEDESGAPVPNATLWSASQSWEYPVTIARCNAAGEATISGARSECTVFATAPGFRASPQAVLERSPGQSRELVFRLEAGGEWVRGEVVDEAGAAIPGAEIRLLGDTALRRVATLGDGSPGYARSKARGFSDARGAFELAAPHGGSCRMGVYAPGYAAYETEVDPTDSAHRRITLRDQCSVSGRILLPNGEPARGASISAGPVARDGSALRLRVVSCDAAGEFVIDQLPAESLRLLATLRGVGRVEGVVELEDGEETRWEAILDAGLQIKGTLKDPDGKPAAGLIVIPEREGSRGRSPGRSDERGEFALPNLQPGRYRVRVIDASGTTLHRWEDLVLRETSLELQAVVERPRRGRIAFEIRELPPLEEDASVWRAVLWSSDGKRRISNSLVDGAKVAFDELPAGKYCLSVDHVNSSGITRPHAFLACGVRLEAGKALDLGRLAYVPPGSLRVVSGTRGPARLFHHGHRILSFGGRPGRERTVTLAEGRYRLQWNGTESELLISSGSRTTLDLR